MEEHHSVITPTIEKGSLVLVTGVSSFIGSAIVNQLLSDGYNVRGTVRSLEKIKWLQKLCDERHGEGKFEAFEVADMVADGAFDEAVKGVSGICHTASVTTFSDNPDEVIPPVVKGALNILTSATKEPGVKSVVYCSSSTAALMPQPNKEIEVTKDTFDQAAVDEAYGPTPTAYGVYGASKTEAERALWEAVKKTNPPFQVATVLPDTNFGPIIEPGGENGSTTATFIPKLFNGDESIFDIVPPQYFVDVRDTAKLHVIAMIDPACNGERLFAFADTFNWNQILGILRKLYPDKTFIEDKDDTRADLSHVPREHAEALLKKHYGRGFISLEDSVLANTEVLVK